MNVVVNKADSSDLRDLVVLTCEFLEDVASQAGMAGFVPDDQKIREKLPEFLGYARLCCFCGKVSERTSFRILYGFPDAGTDT